MPAEQVLERVASTADDGSTAPREPSPASQTANESARHDDGEGFSPDPQRRTDRYKLVTPYLLRL